MTFTTYGRLNSSKDNCIIVGHSLTSNTNIHEWWDTFMGEHAPSQPIMQSSPQSPQPLDSIPPRDLYKSEGPALDPSLFFVVCINYISSPYGTISPISFKPKKSVEPEKKRRRVESENSPKCSTGETRTEPDIDAREDDSKGKHDQSEGTDEYRSKYSENRVFSRNYSEFNEIGNFFVVVLAFSHFDLLSIQMSMTKNGMELISH